MSDARTNKITPNIELKKDETIKTLQEILNYTALIRKLIGDKKKHEILMILKGSNASPKKSCFATRINLLLKSHRNSSR